MASKRVQARAGHFGTILKYDNFRAMALVKWDPIDTPLWQFTKDLTPIMKDNSASLTSQEGSTQAIKCAAVPAAVAGRMRFRDYPSFEVFGVISKWLDELEADGRQFGVQDCTDPRLVCRGDVGRLNNRLRDLLASPLEVAE